MLQHFDPQIGDLIVFDAGAHMNRANYIFARIDKIQGNGKLFLAKFENERHNEYSDPTMSRSEVTPILNGNITSISILPKRGKFASSDFYRYDKHDITIEMYNSNKIYTEHTYW